MFLQFTVPDIKKENTLTVFSFVEKKNNKKTKTKLSLYDEICQTVMFPLDN